MEYNEELTKVSKINIAYIGGGSHNWARIFMNDISQDNDISGEVRLYDIDFQAAKANEVIGNKISDRWEYKAVEKAEEALTDADFVFISILPGSFEEMKIDVHMPEKYGIYQSVGDTVGIGGIFRSWRTVPMIAEIAENIKKYCPEAWVVNFTNPMSNCIKTLYEVFPEIKAYGCCHEVFGTQKLLKAALEEKKGLKNIDFREIMVNVKGINHFTWIDRASYKGIDLLPIYRDFVEEYKESGFQKGEKNWFNDHFVSAERVKFDLFRKYNCIAAAGDRHLAEFVPNDWYLHDNEKWMFKLTLVDWRISNRKELIKETEDLLSGKKEFEKKEDSGEDFVRQIKGILGLKDAVTNINIPNYGQVENIEKGAIVETNAFFTTNYVSPIMAGNVDDKVLELMKPHIENQSLIVKACLSRDKELLYKAFRNDPQGASLKEEDAGALFSEMFEALEKFN